jgi:hypothetical protein
MKNKYKSLLFFAMGLFWAENVNAQESTNSSGGNDSGSGGTVSYSIGQLVYTTNSNTDGSIAQGVQQAYEIFTIGIAESSWNIQLDVFPNPTNDNLTLLIDNFKIEMLSYHLLDQQGKIISKAPLIVSETQINLSHLMSATYFVDIIDNNNKKVQSFKIIKN